MTASSPSNALQSVFLLFESDAIVSFGPALIGLIQAEAAAGTDPLKIALAWVQFQGALAGAAPNALAGMEGQLANFIVSHIQAAIAKAAGVSSGGLSSAPSVASSLSSGGGLPGS